MRRPVLMDKECLRNGALLHGMDLLPIFLCPRHRWWSSAQLAHGTLRWAARMPKAHHQAGPSRWPEHYWDSGETRPKRGRYGSSGGVASRTSGRWRPDAKGCRCSKW